MKTFTSFITLLCILFLGFSTTGQTRYLDPVFEEVKVTQEVTYGVNATVLFYQVFGEAVPRELVMDVYEPQNDNTTDRPLVLLFHTGNFLPFPQNTQPTGTIRDSSIVEVATRLAKMGYVAASVDYRLGWNPAAPTEEERRYSLINAAYRGVQDARTCIRYFRKDHAETGNTFGIDPSKIVIWGQGTGGYIALNTMILDDYNKIPSTPKFVTVDSMGNPIPMVIPQVNGDINGTSVGVNPLDGDTLCYPNHLGYSSDFAMSVNLGGAAGDTSWVDPGQQPCVSFHVPTDMFAPYKEGVVIVPIQPPQSVVTVQGSYLVQKLANEYGNNDPFISANINDNYTQVANSKNDGHKGLCPLIGSIPEDNAPWDWWNSNNPNHQNGLMTNPDMSPEKARSYIDTIIGYYAPRAYAVLDLMTATEDVSAESISFELYPNPASGRFRLQTDVAIPIRSVHLFDLDGQLIRSIESLHRSQMEIERNGLPSGPYLIRVETEEGGLWQKVIFQ